MPWIINGVLINLDWRASMEINFQLARGEREVKTLPN